MGNHDLARDFALKSVLKLSEEVAVAHNIEQKLKGPDGDKERSVCFPLDDLSMLTNALMESGQDMDEMSLA